jgi:hypothetical protein
VQRESPPPPRRPVRQPDDTADDRRLAQGRLRSEPPHSAAGRAPSPRPARGRDRVAPSAPGPGRSRRLHRAVPPRERRQAHRGVAGEDAAADKSAAAPPSTVRRGGTAGAASRSAARAAIPQSAAIVYCVRSFVPLIVHAPGERVAMRAAAGNRPSRRAGPRTAITSLATPSPATGATASVRQRGRPRRPAHMRHTAPEEVGVVERRDHQRETHTRSCPRRLRARPQLREWNRRSRREADPADARPDSPARREVRDRPVAAEVTMRTMTGLPIAAMTRRYAACWATSEGGLARKSDSVEQPALRAGGGAASTSSGQPRFRERHRMPSAVLPDRRRALRHHWDAPCPPLQDVRCTRRVAGPVVCLATRS